MAVDESLARSERDDEGVLRIYRWSRPTLSFGRNQPARQRYDPLAARVLGVEVVRRPTGGREVLHDRELTYSVTAPLEILGGSRAAYRTLNEALVRALRSMGAPALHLHLSLGGNLEARPAVHPR
jgi:lipoyl(octanoyl) transferase